MNDEFFQALASPYRREIIRLLKQKRELIELVSAKERVSHEP